MIHRAALLIVTCATLAWAPALQAGAPSTSPVPQARPASASASQDAAPAAARAPAPLELAAAQVAPPPRPSLPATVADAADANAAAADRPATGGAGPDGADVAAATPAPTDADVPTLATSAPRSLPRILPQARPAGLAPAVVARAAGQGRAAAAVVVAAAASSPATPLPRPASLARATPPAQTVAARAATAPAASRLAVATSRLPRPRSETDRLRHLRRVSAAAAVRTQPAPSVATGRASGNLCGVAGIEGQSIPAVTSNVRGCGIENPVRVTAVDGVALSRAAVLHCDAARALHQWVRQGLKPNVGTMGGGVAELRVAAHYVCRTRNHRPNAPVSEHGRGRAIDISAIRLRNGEVMTILRDWRSARYGPILRAAHRAACGTFTTTLGPGSDGFHEDHLHFDVALRRGVGPICR